MSTVVFTIAGGAIGNFLAPGVGGIIGGAIGAGVGGYIDNSFLYPSLFPPKDTLVGKLKQIELDTVSEGAPANYCFGPHCRVGGARIWQSELKETSRRLGGKGGPAGKITKYSYSVDLAIAVSHTEIRKIRKIYADGKIIFSEEPAEIFESNQVSARVVKVKPLAPLVDTTVSFLEIVCPTSVSNFKKFRSGAKLVVSGFANAQNNTGNEGKKIISIRGEGSNSVIRIFSGEGVKDEAAGHTITLSQTIDKFAANRADSFTFYTGSQTQNQDPLIAAYEGTENVPSYRGVAYVVIQGLQLEYYGNRVPTFSFEVDAGDHTVAQAVSAVYALSGLAPEDYDVTALDVPLNGAVFTASNTAANFIETLALAYGFTVQEVGGKMVFFFSEERTPIPIDSGDYGAKEDSNETFQLPSVTDINILAPLSEVIVKYIDIENDLQVGTQRERRQGAFKPNIYTIDMPISMDAPQAKELAVRTLWQSWRSAQQIEFTLPPTYISIDEGDLISLTYEGLDLQAIVTSITRGRNGIAEIVGTITETAAHTVTPFGPTGVAQKGGLVASVLLEIIDLAPLRDSDTLLPGYYYAASNDDPAESWRGAAVYVSKDGDNFEFINGLSSQCTIGETVEDVTQHEVIVDNETTPGALPSGMWSLSSQGNDPYGGSNRINSTNAGNFKWEFTVPVGGNYEVFVYFSTAGGRSTKALYEILHDSGTAQKRIDQSDTYISDRWVSLGIYNFSGFGSVTLYAQDDGNVCADAVRVLKTVRALHLGNARSGYIDRLNTLTVRLYSGSLESRSLVEVCNGQNIAAVGEEIVGFLNAELIAPNTYKLSNLLRGLRGTEAAILKHRERERFVLLDTAIQFNQINLEDIGQEHQVKIAAPGESVEDILPVKQRVFGNSIVPLPVSFLTSSYLVIEESIGLRWFYRTGRLVRVLNTSKWAETISDLSGFEIDVCKTNGDVRRRVTGWLYTSWGDGTNGFHYNSTEQLADGFTAGETIVFKVYQSSKRVGRGRPAEITAISTI